LELQKILNGILEFSNEYSGKLLTETMIIKSMLFKPEEIEKTADFVLEVNPRTAYLSVPTRPPAEHWVEPPTELELFGVYISFYERGINVAYLAGYEGNNFASTGNVEEDLLGITSVHPMREDAVNKYLKRAHQDPKTINALIKGGKLKETYYNSTKFYIRSLSCTEE